MKLTKIIPFFLIFLMVALFITFTSNVVLAVAGTAPGLQKISHENFTLKIPDTWKEDSDTDTWAPHGEILNMGRPKTSLHVGAIPPMPGKNRDELLAFYYGSVPKTLSKTDKCGMEGLFVEIDTQGYKHHGLILIEDIGPIKLLNFFDCQSPTADFHKKQDLFKQILDSVTCK